MLPRTTIILGAAILAAIPLSACGGSSGGGTGGSGGSGTGGHGGSTTTHTSSSSTGGSSACGSSVWSANAQCNACMEQSCCDKLAACGAGTSCGSVVECIAACAPGDATCPQDCQSSQPDGAADLDALIACYEANCKTTPACGAEVCDSGFVLANADCGDCLTANCCDSWKACAEDQTCSDCLVTHAAVCGDPASGSGKLFEAAMACEKGQCAMDCTVGICDSGLGTASSPCDYCLGHNCCAEVKTCAAEQGCLDCLTSGGQTAECKDAGTSTGQAYEGVTDCWASNCASACGG